MVEDIQASTGKKGKDKLRTVIGSYMSQTLLAAQGCCLSRFGYVTGWLGTDIISKIEKW
jgi:hypothetical protein